MLSESDRVAKPKEARRQRSDEISELMGIYLLKGWRMLATSCPVCDTILFNDLNGNPYCVACNEVDKVEQASINESLSINVCGDVPSNPLRSPSTDSSEESFDVIGSQTDEKSFPKSVKAKKSSKSSFARTIREEKSELDQDLHFPVLDTNGDIQNHQLSGERRSEVEKQRNRSDKISKIMGEYLLKGWRMLDQCCTVCDTILMLSRDGKLHCIGCCEVDTQQLPPQIQETQPSQAEPSKNVEPSPISTKPEEEKPKIKTTMTATESKIIDAIQACSSRVVDCSLSMDVERYATAVKVLSEALLNVRQFSSQ